MKYSKISLYIIMWHTHICHFRLFNEHGSEDVKL